jgi:hypothetical protein
MSTDRVRVAWDQPATPHDLHADCRAVTAKIRYDRIASADAPSLHYADRVERVEKPEVSVDEATARLAAAIYGE